MEKSLSSYFNYNKFIIIIFIFYLVVFQIPEFHSNIISKILAVSSFSIVRQEIIDDENDWKPWKIENEKNSESSEKIKSNKCNDLRPISLPDLQSLSYKSNGDKLNVTLWLTQTFSEVLYENILKNETFSDISEGSFDSSLSSSSLPRIVQFVMVIDIVSTLNRGIDYIVELSSPTETDNPVWTQNIYEISAFGNKKPLYNKTLNSFPYNDKNFVDLSINLKSIGNPDKYKLLFYIVDIYPVDGEYCRIIDTSNWTLIPFPDFDIFSSTSNIVMRPPEEKSIALNINTNSDLESKAVLGINYTNDDEDDEENKVNINFISNKTTISPFSNNSAVLKIIALEDKQLKVSKQIPIKIFANISFPQTITNRGGDTYYNNKTISMLEFSDLTLTLLPPLTFNEQLDNFTKSIQPIGQLWGVFTTIGLGISGFITFLYKRRKDKKQQQVKEDKKQKEKKE